MNFPNEKINVFVFVCSLVNNTVSNRDYISSKRLDDSEKLERIWKEKVMIQFKVLFCHFLIGTDESSEEPQL
jgi:hypothetical protein